jgi:hypothetical protein
MLGVSSWQIVSGGAARPLLAGAAAGATRRSAAAWRLTGGLLVAMVLVQAAAAMDRSVSMVLPSLIRPFTANPFYASIQASQTDHY